MFAISCTFWFQLLVQGDVLVVCGSDPGNGKRLFLIHLLTHGPLMKLSLIHGERLL